MKTSKNKCKYEIWDSHGNEDVDVCLLSCNAAWIFRLAGTDSISEK